MKFLTQLFIALSLLHLQTFQLEANSPATSHESPEQFNFSKMSRNENINITTSSDKEFVLGTIPKSGSHLTIKLLVMLTGKTLSSEGKWQFKTAKEIQLASVKAEKNNQFFFLHLGDRESQPFDEFFKQNPSYVKIVQIRDLRDCLVSLVFHMDKSPENWNKNGLNENASMSEKLEFLLQGKSLINGSPILNHAKNAVFWKNDPQAIVIRFEDIIGPSGGGDSDLQRETICNLANVLGVELSSERLDYIADNLFGTTSGPTVPESNFRKGQIGSWKEYFNEEHVRLFNQIWGDYQQELGYPLAEWDNR